jgi:hypothetical protein
MHVSALTAVTALNALAAHYRYDELVELLMEAPP